MFFLLASIHAFNTKISLKFTLLLKFSFYYNLRKKALCIKTHLLIQITRTCYKWFRCESFTHKTRWKLMLRWWHFRRKLNCLCTWKLRLNLWLSIKLSRRKNCSKNVLLKQFPYKIHYNNQFRNLFMAKKNISNLRPYKFGLST